MADLNTLFSQLLETEGGVEALKAFGERYKAADDEATKILEASAMAPREVLDREVDTATRMLPIERQYQDLKVQGTKDINQIGQERYASDVGALTDNSLRILGASFDDKKDARQMNSADYNTYMNKSFDARDKDRSLLQRGQTLGLIKNILGGAAILFS
tara:strand:- start:35287 stop:35763 length:477 start_codon:yes stop_codon:yes gene_type:complete